MLACNSCKKPLYAASALIKSWRAVVKKELASAAAFSARKSEIFASSPRSMSARMTFNSSLAATADTSAAFNFDFDELISARRCDSCETAWARRSLNKFFSVLAIWGFASAISFGKSKLVLPSYSAVKRINLVLNMATLSTAILNSLFDWIGLSEIKSSSFFTTCPDCTWIFSTRPPSKCSITCKREEEMTVPWAVTTWSSLAK